MPHKLLSKFWRALYNSLFRFELRKRKKGYDTDQEKIYYWYDKKYCLPNKKELGKYEIEDWYFHRRVFFPFRSLYLLKDRLIEWWRGFTKMEKAMLILTTILVIMTGMIIYLMR